MTGSQQGPARLRTLRTRAGLTQQALALAANLSVRTVRNLEAGRHTHRPFLATIDLVCAALQLAPGERDRLVEGWSDALPVATFGEISERLDAIAADLRRAGVADPADYHVLHRTRRVRIGADRRIAAQHFEQLVVARRPGVSRLYQLFPDDPLVDVGEMIFQGAHSCSLNSRMVQDVRVLEIDLGRALDAGEQQFIGFSAGSLPTVDGYSSRGRVVPVAETVMSGFRAGVGNLIVHVSFEGVPPALGWTLRGRSPGQLDRVDPVTLDPWGCLTFAGSDLPAGTYGLRWQW